MPNTKAQETPYVIREIIVAGNTKTNLDVILRECPFSINDTITAIQLKNYIEKYESNLSKTSLFNFVTITYQPDSVYADIIVNVEERWYFWPYPILEHAERNLTTFLNNMDMNKINYGLAADIYNLRGKNETLRLKFRLGYKEHYSLSFQKNGCGLQKNSSLRFKIEMFRQKSSEYSIVNNKPLYISDDANYIKKDFNIGINYGYRPELNYVFNFGINYKNSVFKDSILFSNHTTSGDEFKSSFLNPYFVFNYDSRNNKIYPVKGVQINLYYGENRSLSDITGAYSTFGLYSQYNKQIAKTRVSFRSEFTYLFMKDYEHKPIVFSNKLEFCRNFWIRGYELFYFVGNEMIGFQNTIGIKISDFKIHRIASFLPGEFSKTYSRIYLDIFFDICRVQSWNNEDLALNPMNDKLLYSGGLAVNLETYYDRLLSIYVAYIGYSGKTGIFVNYKTPLDKLF
ncbi:MAG: hypothetical protein PHW83_07295 [Bacteroidales bacterium]|nr:hypothetical protein [Bacteroidales bacterium]